MKRVVIVGMGFGGIEAARSLKGKGFEVLVIDRQNYHLFQPLLYQVATATLDTAAIAFPIRKIIHRWPGVRFRMAEVTGVDLERREVLTDDGPISYDYLVLAAGSASNFFGMESIKRKAYDLKLLSDAINLRNHVLGVFERAAKETDPQHRAALMTFVIVGGGPTGVEFAGALSELIRTVLTRDYPELRVCKARIILIEAIGHILAPFPEKLRRYAQSRLQEIGVEVRVNTPVAGAEPGRVLLKDGSSIPSYTLFWAAGVQAAPLANALPVPKAKGGRIPVQHNLSLEGHPEVFVIGDMAYFEQDGSPLPMMAPVAMQQGTYVGRAILAQEHCRTIQPFRYTDRGSMAVIGRYAAVALVFNRAFSGFLAWIVWLALHLVQLIGFRNRLITLLNWTYDYLFFERQVRLITRMAERNTAMDTVEEEVERAVEAGGVDVQK